MSFQYFLPGHPKANLQNNSRLRNLCCYLLFSNPPMGFPLAQCLSHALGRNFRRAAMLDWSSKKNSCTVIPQRIVAFTGYQLIVRYMLLLICSPGSSFFSQGSRSRVIAISQTEKHNILLLAKYISANWAVGTCSAILHRYPNPNPLMSVDFILEGCLQRGCKSVCSTYWPLPVM